MMKLTVADFEELLGAEGTLPETCLRSIECHDFSYKILDSPERDKAIIRVLEALKSPLEKSGAHRLNRWEDGWTENLNEFIASGYDPATLIPKFVKRNELIRLRGEYIQPADPDFETNFVIVLRNYLFSRFFSDPAAIYEFGCGTGHNLLALADLFPGKRLYGFDWTMASTQILSLLKDKLNLPITGGRFDLFSPDPDLQLENGAGVFTVGTLEQAGSNFTPFLEWMLEQPFSVCIHIETLHELYDKTRLLDYLAAEYLEKRNYLRGYLEKLRALEKKKRIRIINVKRTFGSFYHDGYSYIVWEKV
jgi:hypothetical protein